MMRRRGEINLKRESRNFNEKISTVNNFFIASSNLLLNCGDAKRMFLRSTGLMPGLAIALQLPFRPVEATLLAFEGDFPLSASIN